MAELDTRITRILEAAEVPFRVLPHTCEVFTVADAAAERGVDPAAMVKSILLVDEKGRLVMACLPGTARLDYRRVQELMGPGWRRLHFVGAEKVEAVTGCRVGAVTPLGLPDGIPILIDETLVALERVNISSGDPMAGLELDPADLLRLSGARVVDLSNPGQDTATDLG